MSYINPTPGNSATQVTLELDYGTLGGSVSVGVNALAVPALQDVTINASTDVFSWATLDSGAKSQVATTATNSLSGNLVVDNNAFFGDSTATGDAEKDGLFGLSAKKQLVNFALRFTTDGTDRVIKGQGYVTGLSPSISAQSPVWVSPFTLTVTGSFTVAAS